MPEGPNKPAGTPGRVSGTGRSEGGAKAPLKAERFVPGGPNKPDGTPGRACGTGRSETTDARLATFEEVERAILEGAPWLAGPVRERMLPLLPKLRAFRAQVKK